MKKKYLKKMLAIMLASMTVSATPGLVGAMKEESKKAIQEANSKIANNALTQDEATNMLDKLEEMANEDDEAKKEVADTLGNMIHEGLFGRTSHYVNATRYGDHFDAQMCSSENLSKIIKIFKTCSTSDTAKRNTAWAIRIMAREGLLGRTPSESFNFVIPQCSQEILSDVIDILDKCLEYKDSAVKEVDYSKTREHVANSVFQMANRGVLGSSFNKEPFRKCQPDQASKIMEFLEKCLKDNEEPVAYSISFLASCDLLDQYPKDKILNMLQQCFENPEATESVAEALCGCAAENLLEKNSLGSILDILEKCSHNREAVAHVAYAIYFMSKHDMFGGDSMDRILNILCSCSDNFYIREDAVRGILDAIVKMAEKGMINDQTIDKYLVRIFENWSQKHDRKEYTAEAIKNIAQKDLLNQCSPDTLRRIIDSLLACRAHNDFSRRNVSEAIQAMAEQNILYRCEPNQIQEIAGALADCLEPYFFPHEAINAITAMNNKDLLNQCDSAGIQQLADSLIRCLSRKSSRDAAANAILAMNEKGLLNKCEPGQIQQIVSKLVGLLENNNTQEAATIIILAMAKNPETFNKFNSNQLSEILNLFKTHVGNYLANGNYERVDRIFEVFKKCSEIDDLKADVANIIESLIQQSKNFYQYLNHDSETPVLGNFLDILISCSKAQDAETQKKAMFAILAVIHNMNTLINTIIEIPDKIPQIIEMLEELSRVEQVKVYVADAIRLLGEKNLLNNQSQADGHRLVNAINNCLTYGEERISVKESVDENQADIAIAVRRIFEDQPWTESFIQHLSPNDAARFIDLAYESKTAADKVGNDVYQSFQQIKN